MIKAFLRRIVFTLLYFFYKPLFYIIFEWSFRIGELSYLSKEDFNVWKCSMCSMIKEDWLKGHWGFVLRKIIFSFCMSPFKIIRKTDPCDKNNPIVTLCVKNDIKRIKMLVDHYRTLGVVKFAVMDNGSNDGTFEWLLDQPDIDLYQCMKPYQTYVKEGWINRIISYYGFDRWYIVTDSDEIIVYCNMETESLSNLTKRMDNLGLKRAKALTLDTYCKTSSFKKSENIRNDYKWIDSDSYEEIICDLKTYRIKRFIGGPRYRLMKSMIPLDKHPLVYWDKGTVSDNAHYQFPHDLIDESPCYLGILHYKFIDIDLEEYKNRASKKSAFASHGGFYREYMAFFNEQQQISFMYDGSIEFVSSETLKRIPFIKQSLSDSSFPSTETDFSPYFEHKTGI